MELMMKYTNGSRGCSDGYHSYGSIGGGCGYNTGGRCSITGGGSSIDGGVVIIMVDWFYCWWE